MRVVGVVIAALLTLGLAAFGVVTAQNAAGPSSLIALAVHVISPSQNSGTAALQAASNQAPANQAPAPVAQSRVAPQPVVQVAEATVVRSDAPPAAPTVLAQNAPAPSPAPAPTAPPASAAPAGAASPAPAAKAIPTCSNPDAIGLSRVVEIDTTGGPAFGTEHFKQYDFLRDKEVVLTFDDGPWPENTPMVLKALQDNCIKATFFEIGEHATWRPDLTKELVAAGMTVGSHTWSHKDLAKNPYAKDIEQAKQEIEMGVSAVHMAAAGGAIAPFFRFPDLQQPAELMTYLGTRNIAIFSTDIDTFDFKLRKPEDVIKSAMTKLAKNGKGILLMHDFQHATAEAMPELLRQLKAGGYKIVHMVPKAPVTTLAKYDDMVRAQDKFSASNNTRPESSVVKTISE
jgi:peptidoglycan/xylan/chitin deacetylase (PgdA/CDA1 family)